jgi:glycosyltransferase involved in cell wall biosynthesis
MERTTVCQVVHSLSVGGTELLACNLGRRLSNEFRIVYACLDEAGALAADLQREGFAVRVIGRSPGIDFGCARRLARFLRAEHVDLVHAHQYTPFFYALIPGLFRTRSPILFTEHGRFFPDVPRPKRIVFNRVCLRRRDRVVAVGNSVRQALITNEGIPAERIAVIHNGVDLRHACLDRPIRCQVRQQLGIEESAVVIIQVARLDPLKDYGTAIRTMARLKELCPQARLLLVGEGPEREKIEQEIARHQVAASIKLLGYRSDVAQLLRAADVMLLTSISEGIPVTLIEGMGAALPIVATDVGGVSEVIHHGDCGYLTPAGDDRALADALFRLASDPAMRERMGRQGAVRARDLFSEERMIQAYRNLYREMLDE